MTAEETEEVANEVQCSLFISIAIISLTQQTFLPCYSDINYSEMVGIPVCISDLVVLRSLCLCWKKMIHCKMYCQWLEVVVRLTNWQMIVFQFYRSDKSNV